MKICTMPGCGRKLQAKGFCATHYWRSRKFGDAFLGGDIRPASKGGIRKHPMYGAWAGMINRCHNPNHSSYDRYGARGIVVTERWKEFANFLKDMGDRPEGHTLDRIDPSGPYAPCNCRWATPKQQRQNITAEGRERQREGARAGALRRHAANI